jgi:serine/threonine-protein kinase RIO1
MYLHKLVKSNTGKYVMSILLGIGLATIFRSVCKGKECSVYMAPALDEIEDKIYKFDGKCYKFERLSKNCDSTKRIVQFA